jgi:cellulose synthase/poly-beta-1,6-N-acetylglucosamine synthase-like glycosyltransferase
MFVPLQPNYLQPSACSVRGTVGYPALIWVLAKLAPKPVRKGDILPTVTCVIAARDEEHRIGAKLENLLSSHYPSDRLDIIVVSDGSTDQTCAVVEKWINKYKYKLRCSPLAKSSYVPPLIKGARGVAMRGMRSDKVPHRSSFDILTVRFGG